VIIAPSGDGEESHWISEWSVIDDVNHIYRLYLDSTTISNHHEQFTFVNIDLLVNNNNPTPTPTPTQTSTPAETPEPTPTPTQSPTNTSTPTQTQTSTPAETPEPTPTPTGAGNIQFNISYDSSTSFSQTQKSQIELAVNKWKSIIRDDRVIELSVEYVLEEERASSGLLGYAQPLTVDTEKYLPLSMRIAFDPLDLSSAEPPVGANPTPMDQQFPSEGLSLLYYIALHEIGHGLGIGSLWGWPDDAPDPDIVESRQLVVNGFSRAPLNEPSTYPTGTAADEAFTSYASQSPIYIGAHGVAAYQQVLIDSGWKPDSGLLLSIDSLPVEDEGGPGTMGSHLEENYYTRWVEQWAEVGFGNELMTGFLNGSTVNPLSKVTIGLLKDLGWSVDESKSEVFTIPKCKPVSAYGYGPCYEDMACVTMVNSDNVPVVQRSGSDGTYYHVMIDPTSYDERFPGLVPSTIENVPWVVDLDSNGVPIVGNEYEGGVMSIYPIEIAPPRTQISLEIKNSNENAVSIRSIDTGDLLSIPNNGSTSGSIIIYTGEVDNPGISIECGDNIYNVIVSTYGDW